MGDDPMRAGASTREREEREESEKGKRVRIAANTGQIFNTLLYITIMTANTDELAAQTLRQLLESRIKEVEMPGKKLTPAEQESMFGKKAGPKEKSAKAIDIAARKKLKETMGDKPYKKLNKEAMASTIVRALRSHGLLRTGYDEGGIREILNKDAATSKALNRFVQTNGIGSDQRYEYTHDGLKSRDRPFFVNQRLQLVGGPAYLPEVTNSDALIPLTEKMGNRKLTRVMGNYFHPSASPNVRKILYRIGRWVKK